MPLREFGMNPAFANARQMYATDMWATGPPRDMWATGPAPSLGYRAQSLKKIILLWNPEVGI